ncbi:DUF4124 domain-containing protein [Pseudomonas sp. 9Ag]|uniref:DUF4124 domain-containing protein n=1 Tax=Pseudomonas sp. 9Ag TaxID=2653167 RepID=UPI0012F0396C|nr:DUF4124 domain-containing protein [Pseudomonas sp. 9Ag]VXC97008.1 Penicillin-binding protein [Pseudomonas sp. 9Ag]
MKRLSRLGLVGLLLACALPASAAIYSYIDVEGNRVFTDRPDGRAVEQVETKPANTMAAQPLPPPKQAVKVLKATAPSYILLDILLPAPDATIRNNAGELAVSVTSQPPLHPGHQYRLLLDGAPASAPGESPVLTLQNIDRGSHQLVVEVIDSQGERVQSSEPRAFHMMRTSLAQRRMVNPCRKADYGVRPECPLKDKPKEKKDIPFVPFL